MGTDLKVSRSLDGYVIFIKGPDLVAKRFTQEVLKMAIADHKARDKDYNPLHLPFRAGKDGEYEIWGMLNESISCIMPRGEWTVHTAFTEEELKDQ